MGLGNFGSGEGGSYLMGTGGEDSERWRRLLFTRFVGRNLHLHVTLQAVI